MPITLTILSDLFADQPEQTVIVRDDLTVQRLLGEIQKEYELQDAYYALRFKDREQPLDPANTLEQCGVRQGAVLVYEIRKPSSTTHPVKTAFLRATNGQTYELLHRPALIGRPNPEDKLTAAMLDVDLTPLDPDRTSSRPHARIHERGGVYYLESTRSKNPAYVNEKPVPVGTEQPLKHEDKLRFGQVTLQFLTQ